MTSLHGQKLIKKSLINSDVSFFQIDTDNCFILNLGTSKGKELVVEALMDGEYSKDLLIKMREEGSTMFIGAGFEPNFVNPNDKLSAHKVVSIALNINLPEHHKVKVLGTNCNVEIEGSYSSLEVILDDGRCTLNGVKEQVEVRTQSGDINLYNAEGKVLAETKYGHIIKEIIPGGDSTFALHSVSGNISLNKVQ
ncbi:MAG: DUF4097 family beta strand repeat-containing protein [Flavobacteriaceae bacterium]